MARKQNREWSATGAARAAREARIATVEYLRSAPIARVWHKGKLMSAFQLLVDHLGDQYQKEAAMLMLGGMSYGPPYPGDWQSVTDMVVDDEARYLAEAELYVLSPQMCDVVIAAAQTLTREDLELLDEEDLPSPTGLVVLPYPIIVRAITGDLADDRAFSWRIPAHIQKPTADMRGLEEAPAVRMSAYHDAHGPVQPDTFLAIADAARAQGTPLPPLLLDAIRCMPFRYVASAEQTKALHDFLDVAQRKGAAEREQSATDGQDENRVIGEYTPGTEITDHDDTFMPRFLYAFWRLCEQRIAVVGDAEIKHSARVLAERAGVPAEVRVVDVRQSARPEPRDGETAGRDWQHRWVVRMHKVRQWYPSEQRHRVIYRGPYIKGPADKPLLGGEVVRSVTRAD